MFRFVAVFVAVVGLLPMMAKAQALPDAQGALFLEFARDVSGNDAAVMQKAEQLIKSPPTTLEEIGFYGLEEAPAPERTLRGIISRLGGAGYFFEFEDKYIYEMPLVLEQEGVAAFADDALKDPLMLFGGDIDYDDGPTDAQWQTFRSSFGPHLRAIEAAVRRTGNDILSLNMPLGDTMYVWITSPKMARKWRNRGLYVGVNTVQFRRTPFVSMTVTDPSWDVYWGFLTYAIGIPEAYADMPDYE